tara:strand:+ start:1011 stop:1454 length:444 start_codon:yes stop_codon:yes gene_type:complete
MDEITQKNIVLIATCIVVICFHLAYKFKDNQKTCNILLGIGFFVGLVITKLLYDWEKKNKTDYNLVLFLYILIDLVIFLFLIYRYCDQKGIMRGGGGGKEFDIIDEFKQQDFVVKDLSESPLTMMVAEKLKEKATNYIVGILSKFKL